MIKNMGNADRIVRFILGISIVILYFTEELSSGAVILLGTVAVIFLATSLTGTCLVYYVTNLSTKRD